MKLLISSILFVGLISGCRSPSGGGTTASVDEPVSATGSANSPLSRITCQKGPDTTTDRSYSIYLFYPEITLSPGTDSSGSDPLEYSGKDVIIMKGDRIENVELQAFDQAVVSKDGDGYIIAASTGNMKFKLRFVTGPIVTDGLASTPVTRTGSAKLLQADGFRNDFKRFIEMKTPFDCQINNN